MKDNRNPSFRKSIGKGRPDYYITPTHDFTQYTKDSEEKYWSQNTKFNWNLSVQGNLKEHLDNLDPEHFAKIIFMVLPMVAETLERKIVQIRQCQLPGEEDPLKDIAECLPFDRTSIHQALLRQSLRKIPQLSVSNLKD